MIHAANTVTYNTSNNDKSFNKEMSSDIILSLFIPAVCYRYTLRYKGSQNTALLEVLAYSSIRLIYWCSVDDMFQPIHLGHLQGIAAFSSHSHIDG